MKARWYAALLCLAIPGSIALADDMASSGPYITTGDFDLLFNFDVFNIASFLPNGVGARYWISDAVAIRGGVQFATVDQTLTAPAGETAGSQSATTIGITGGVEYHLTQTQISPYIGGEVNFTSTSVSSTPVAEAGAAQITTSDPTAGVTINGNYYQGGLMLGVGGLAGVEFFVTKGVSLGAEYRLGWDLKSMYNQTSPSATAAGNINSFGLSSSGGLTVSIKF
jgi:opacity protein-like surface antigen